MFLDSNVGESRILAWCPLCQTYFIGLDLQFLILNEVILKFRTFQLLYMLVYLPIESPSSQKREPDASPCSSRAIMRLKGFNRL